MDREFEKAKNCAFRLLKFRMRSKQELRDRLKRNLLKIQLKQKGVNEAIIEESLSDISRTDELTTAKTIAEKRFSKLKALPVNVMKRRLHDYLRRRGFNTSTSIKIINELTNDEQRPD